MEIKTLQERLEEIAKRKLLDDLYDLYRLIQSNNLFSELDEKDSKSEHVAYILDLFRVNYKYEISGDITKRLYQYWFPIYTQREIDNAIEMYKEIGELYKEKTSSDE